MAVPAGPWHIDDLLTFTVVTHKVDTGVLTDADSVPSYRIYEDETGTAILTGSMAKLDDSNTTGFYSEQITLSAANGFENGKSYAIYVSATVNSVVGGQTLNFKVDVPDVNVTAMANNVMTAAAAASDLTTELQSGLATAAALATVDTVVDAIQAKTDNLPADPADQSLIISATDAILSAVGVVDGVVDAILIDTAEIGAAGAGLTALASAANLATVDTVVDAVKVQTDKLTFTVANQVDVNVESINATEIIGDGSAGAPFNSTEL